MPDSKEKTKTKKIDVAPAAKEITKKVALEAKEVTKKVAVEAKEVTKKVALEAKEVTKKLSSEAKEVTKKIVAETTEAKTEKSATRKITKEATGEQLIPKKVDLAVLGEDGKDLAHREEIGKPPAKRNITPEERAERLERDIVHMRKTLKIKPWEHIPVVGPAIYELRVDTHLTEAEDNLIVGYAFEEGMKFMLKGLIVFSALALIISPLAWKYIIEKAVKRGVHALENKHLIPPQKSVIQKKS